MSEDPILRASGARLFGASGRAYLDFANAIVAYQHPVLVKEASAALDQMPLSSRMLFAAPLGRLASRLAGMMWDGAAVVYPCNSPSEAMEGALKLALGVHHGRRNVFVTPHDSFHGKTLGALSVSGAAGDAASRLSDTPFRSRKIALTPEDLDAIDDSVAAVILEPVQPSRGLAPLAPGFLEQVRRVCSRSGALLIMNEALTGLGRVGRWFGWQACASDTNRSAAPDVLVLGDALGGNLLPYGVYLAREELNSRVYKRTSPALHGATTAGHPLGCRIALAVLDLLEAHDIPGKARRCGQMLQSELDEIQETYPDAVLQTVSTGLIGALRLRSPQDARRLVNSCEHAGLLVHWCGRPDGAEWLALLPPLLVSPEEWDEGVSTFRHACAAALTGNGRT